MSTKTTKPTGTKPATTEPKKKAPPHPPSGKQQPPDDNGGAYPRPGNQPGGKQPPRDDPDPRGEPQPKYAGGPAVIPIGDRVRLRCYVFSVTNTDPNRTITEIRIPFANAPLVPSAPDGWVVVPGPPHVVFRTPPPAVGGQMVRPNGIAPGDRLGGFRFYLPDQGRVRSGPVTFGFSDGTEGGLSDVFQGGKKVTPEDDGSFRITRSGTAYARTLKLVAPKDAAVYGAEFTRLPFGNPTDFVGVEPPPGWVANPIERSSITIFTQGGRTPIPPGGSTTTTVYHEAVNARFRWRFLDVDNMDIPGATEIVSLL